MLETNTFDLPNLTLAPAGLSRGEGRFAISNLVSAADLAAVSQCQCTPPQCQCWPPQCQCYRPDSSAETVTEQVALALGTRYYEN
jgi:hypothetical protein